MDAWVKVRLGLKIKRIANPSKQLAEFVYQVKLRFASDSLGIFNPDSGDKGFKLTYEGE